MCGVICNCGYVYVGLPGEKKECLYCGKEICFETVESTPWLGGCDEFNYNEAWLELTPRRR